jgi:hypothetical protein
MEFYTIHGAGHRQCTCAALPSDFRRLACPWSQPTSTPLALRRSRGCSSIFDLSDVSNPQFAEIIHSAKRKIVPVSNVEALRPMPPVLPVCRHGQRYIVHTN